MTKFFSWHWDFVGFGASFLCALHCILWPLILSLGVFTGAHWLTSSLGEWIFIGMSIGIAIWSLQSSFFNKHRNIRPILIATLGFLGLFFAQLEVVSNTHGFMAIGGGLIAYAHFYNWQLINQTKEVKEKTRPWLSINRVIMITLLLLYCFGLQSAFQKNHQPPNKEEILKAVWQQRVQD